MTLIASALLTVAARLQHRQPAWAPSAVVVENRRFSVLPYVAVAATHSLLVWLLAAVGFTERGWIIVIGTITSTTLVVVRQVLAYVDNDRLLDDLNAKVEELNGALVERDLLTSRLHYLAFHDQLTGLANRALFIQRLHAAVDALHTGEEVTLALIDLDNFKPVNDRFGHATGDQLLVMVGERLRVCVREVDCVARLGGDEFGVVVRGLTDHAHELARRIVAAIAQPFTLGAVVAPVSASVGVVVAVQVGRTPQQLLHDADVALYRAKDAGKGSYRLSRV